jgi:hypothetical protein
MHPEIVQEGPGSCPICGMALEPMGVPPKEAENPELIDFTRRLWVAVPLSLIIVVLDMSAHVFGVDLLPFMSPRPEQWLLLVLATPAVLWCGWPFFLRGVESLRSGWLNMFTLIGLGTGAAYLYSLIATIVPGVFPASMRDADGLVPVYFDRGVRAGGESERGSHQACAGRSAHPRRGQRAGVRSGRLDRRLVADDTDDRHDHHGEDKDTEEPAVKIEAPLLVVQAELNVPGPLTRIVAPRNLMARQRGRRFHVGLSHSGSPRWFS